MTGFGRASASGVLRSIIFGVCIGHQADRERKQGGCGMDARVSDDLISCKRLAGLKAMR